MFVKRSLYLIIYYVVVTAFTCLSFSAFFASYTSTKVLQDGLTSESLKFSIMDEQALENNSSAELTNQTLIQQIESNSNSFLLYKGKETSSVRNVYLNQFSLPLPMKNGQKVQKMPEHSIILDHDLLHSTFDQNGESYFSYRGQDYKVIGSFDKENKYIYRNSSLFVSFPLEESAIGEYTVEGVSRETLGTILNKITAEDPSLSYSIRPMISGFKDRMILALRDQTFVAIVFGISIFLIVLSTLGTTLAWLQSKRDEIQARSLVGANQNDIRLWLIKEYLIVLAISFLIGNILAQWVVKSGSFYEIIPETTVTGSFFSLLFFFLIGTCTVLFSTWISSKKAQRSYRGML